MAESDCGSLFEDIGSFLKHCSEDRAQQDSVSEFWRTRPAISAAEITLLFHIEQRPLCAGEAAALLGRDNAETQTLLEALCAIGVLERRDTVYAVSAATSLYLRSLDGASDSRLT